MRILLCLVFLSCSLSATAVGPADEAVDVKHYYFQIEVNDSTDHIAGRAVITLQTRKPTSEFSLDLAGKRGSEGMTVTRILVNGKVIPYRHENDRINIHFPYVASAGEIMEVVVEYHGIPSDGLIISRNKFGDRTFFGDNWPDRAHYWLPCVDHPADKATCEFSVAAPDHYSVVANGRKIEEHVTAYHQRITHWKEAAEIPMKVMAIGVARFAIQEAGKVGNIPVESWVFPQNQDAGFADYRVAVGILDFFQRGIGAYPYEKLANVQSKTRFGGMENASNIFYAENSVDGKQNHEVLIAHEIAHQWFGNSATEKDWHHLWLSEGFATYFSHLFIEQRYGASRMAKDMTSDRVQILGFAKTHSGPIVDTTIVDLMKLLSVNSYQKGSWVLHMLRHELGDTAFWKGVQHYYQTYHNSNALTEDFQHEMEAASGRDLSVFFKQWIRTGGHPRLAVGWRFDAVKKLVLIHVSQVQPGDPFAVQLDIGLKSPAGQMDLYPIQLAAKDQEYAIAADSKPSELVLDPGTWLLFEGEIRAE